jgi:hypothetical protein
VGPYLEHKVRAAQQHASQDPPFKGDAQEKAKELACHEMFRLARPWQPARDTDAEADFSLRCASAPKRK